MIAFRVALAERVVRLGLSLTRLPPPTHPLFGLVVNFRWRVKGALGSFRLYRQQSALMRSPPSSPLVFKIEGGKRG